MMDAAPEEAIQARPQALTAANLKAESAKASSKAPSVASKKKKGPQKPAWAQTAE